MVTGTTLSIFTFPVWTYIVQFFNYLSNYMGYYTLHLIVIITLTMFIYLVRFISRRLRLH